MFNYIDFLSEALMLHVDCSTKYYKSQFPSCLPHYLSQCIKCMHIIMKFFKSPEERQARKIQRHIRATAEVLAQQIEHEWDSQKKTYFRLNAGAPPEGITTKEYMDTIGIHTLSGLGHLSIAKEIAYSPDLSEQATQATSEFTAINPQQPIPKHLAGVRVVFLQV
jgi:hypothetical protein